MIWLALAPGIWEAEQKHDRFKTPEGNWNKTKIEIGSFCKFILNMESISTWAWHRITSFWASKREFVLDGVSERTSRGSVVPSYNALSDKSAQSYFRTPSVVNMLKQSAATTGQLIPASTKNIKLSRRNRIPDSPGIIEIVKRENRFVTDAVKSSSMKTKTKPIIPSYNAMNDQHAANYFKKRSVKTLLRKTCDIKVWLSTI